MELEKILESLEKRGITRKQLPKAVQKREGQLVEFNVNKIYNAVYNAAESVGGHDEDKACDVTAEVIKRLNGKRNGVETVDSLNEITVNTLNDMGYDGVAHAFHDYSKKRKIVRDTLGVVGSTKGKGSTDSFLMVSSFSSEASSGWDRNRIVRSLIDESGIDLDSAKSIAKVVENNIVLSQFPMVTTQLIRELAHTEMLKRGMVENAGKYQNLGIPQSDLENILFSKNKENSNIQANNPEAVAFSISGRMSKDYALNSLFTKDIAKAHTAGEIHLHDLDLPFRVYCSAHSLEYLKKYGLKLDNLQTASSPAKHTEALTGHLNTFFAAMQAYYAGALGVGYTNIFYSTLLKDDLDEKGMNKIDLLHNKNEELKGKIVKLKEEGKDVSLLEELVAEESFKIIDYKKEPMSILTDDEIDGFMKQRAQELIYASSQNAFSRGGQTLFIDFNIHTGVPHYMKDTPAIVPGGKYAMVRDGKRVLLDERKLEEKTASGYNLIELVDGNGRVVMKEKIEEKHGMKNLIQEWNLNEGEKPVVYGDYDKISKRFAKNMLKVWERGDRDGQPFAFPKCDFHVSEETFSDPEQEELLKFATEIASKNGSPYFIFDRDEVTLAACCRLKTAIEDNYVLKHPESIRFCGFQNVTINIPQAAYRAGKNGKKNLEGFFEELDKTMDIAVKAHLQKKEFIKTLQQPGLPQWQTGKPSADGQPYIDLDKATYIVGTIGLNEAIQYLTGKELHELTNEEFTDYALRTIAHMNVKAKEHGKEHGLKFSIEESPAESAARRLSKMDLTLYPESKEFVQGNIAEDRTYYTNSIHVRADAPVDLVSRIEMQSKFHPAIESGAIIHAFIGEERPDNQSIYNLVKKTYENTQSAQLTISPEFTVCRSCSKTHKGLVDTCPECGNKDKATLKGMTRIVGYYSFIDNWNPSKTEELKARQRGDYGVINQQNQPIEMPSLKNANGNVHAYIIGKTGCSVCENLEENLGKANNRLEKDGYGFGITTYKADKEDGLTKAMLAGINLSKVPSLVILDENSNEIYRNETTYRDGKAKLIKGSEVEQAIRNYYSAK
ncbi:MAG: anaerobic ribonucleoside-triphosphate reductase [Candidatus Pacearchaeota archaeon]|jgi:anaerobic ribonucleoside-triphosphate reductase